MSSKRNRKFRQRLPFHSTIWILIAYIVGEFNAEWFSKTRDTMKAYLWSLRQPLVTFYIKTYAIVKITLLVI